MISQMIRKEHIRKAEEWLPTRTPAWYAMLDYFQNALGYNEEVAIAKTNQFFKG